MLVTDDNKKMYGIVSCYPDATPTKETFVAEKHTASCS